MKLALIALTLALAAVATIGEPQYYPMYPNNYYSPYYFRSGESNPWIPQYLPQQRQKQPAASPLAPSGSSPFQPDPSDSRFLFQMLNPTGYTLTISTSTSTAIATAFTTCTTSTAALTTCTAGRRRRGLFYDESAASGRARRGLFYNDKEDDDIFVSEKAAEEKKTAIEEVANNESERSPRQAFFRTASDELVSSYKDEWDNMMVREGRFMQFAVATTTTTSTTTLTVALTAVCASTTSYNVCLPHNK